jgi:hypothetical protein
MFEAPNHLATTSQIALATGHWKKRCEMVSSLSQKTQLGSPCHFLFAKLSLVKIAPLDINHRKILIFSGILPFQIFL